MDSFPLAASILVPMLLLLLLVLLAAFLKSPAVKGWFGEKRVSNRAKYKLRSDDYRAYDNVIIPDGSGTAQIDHVYVSRFGVFIVETKNLSGWIFGRADQPRWTQTIYKRKFKFQNPVHQNFKHIKTLGNLLHLPRSKLHSVIVFTGDSTFKTDMPACVCTLSNFTDYIMSFTTLLMTNSEIAEVCAMIEKGRLVANRSTHSAHVEYVRSKHRQ